MASTDIPSLPTVGSRWTYVRHTHQSRPSRHRRLQTAQALLDSLVIFDKNNPTPNEGRYGPERPYTLVEWTTLGKRNKPLTGITFEVDHYAILEHAQPHATMGASVLFSPHQRAIGHGLSFRWLNGEYSEALDDAIPRVELRHHKHPNKPQGGFVHSEPLPASLINSDLCLARQVGVVDRAQALWDVSRRQVRCSALVFEVLVECKHTQLGEFVSYAEAEPSTFFIYLPVLLSYNMKLKSLLPLTVRTSTYERLAQTTSQLIRALRQLVRNDPTEVLEMDRCRWFIEVEQDSDDVFCVVLQWRHAFNVCSDGQHLRGSKPSITFDAMPAQEADLLASQDVEVSDISDSSAKEPEILVVAASSKGGRVPLSLASWDAAGQVVTAYLRRPSELRSTSPPSVLLTWDIVKGPATKSPTSQQVDFKVVMPARLVPRQA